MLLFLVFLLRLLLLLVLLLLQFLAGGFWVMALAIYMPILHKQGPHVCEEEPGSRAIAGIVVFVIDVVVSKQGAHTVFGAAVDCSEKVCIFRVAVQLCVFCETILGVTQAEPKNGGGPYQRSNLPESAGWMLFIITAITVNTSPMVPGMIHERNIDSFVESVVALPVESLILVAGSVFFSRKLP